jgi:hypothetical protein
MLAHRPCSSSKPLKGSCFFVGLALAGILPDVRPKASAGNAFEAPAKFFGLPFSPPGSFLCTSFSNSLAPGSVFKFFAPYSLPALALW